MSTLEKINNLKTLFTYKNGLCQHRVFGLSSIFTETQKDGKNCWLVNNATVQHSQHLARSAHRQVTSFTRSLKLHSVTSIVFQ